MKHQSVLFSLFKRVHVIANGLNWLRALESMVMKKVKIKIQIYFTSRPIEPEFYNGIVYKFKKIMDSSFKPEDQWSCKRSPDILA